MPETIFGGPGELIPQQGDEFSKHEQECWNHWLTLPVHEREDVTMTVKSELERLLGSIDNWLPAAAKKVNGGVLEVAIRIWPDDVGTDNIVRLTDEEKEQAKEAVETLTSMLEGLED